MIQLNSILLAITIYINGLATSSRLTTRADDSDLELMECGRLPRFRVPTAQAWKSWNAAQFPIPSP